MKKAVIYKITNKINGKIYIGSTVKAFNRRWNEHVHHARHATGNVFQKAIAKYGAINFEKEIICTVLDISFLDEIEDYFIQFYNSLIFSGKGYNMIGVQKGTRDLITSVMKEEWAKPEKRAKRIETMTEGSRHRFEPIVSVHTQSGEVKHYESVHAAMRDGVAQSAIYFCLNGKDKTGQKRCWFRKEEGLTDSDYQSKAKELIGEFKLDFTVPIIAINRHSNVEKEFTNVYECSNFVNIPVKMIRRHLRGEKGYANYIKDYKFKYKV